jgi:hypothetical protein
MLYEKALKGEIECEDYVKENERIEHKSTLLHHEVMSKAIEEMNWSKELDMYQFNRKDFEEYWSWQKNTPHADYYRESWKNIYRWNASQ